MVEGRPWAQTGNRNEKLAPAELEREVKRGDRQAGAEPLAFNNDLWQSARHTTEI